MSLTYHRRGGIAGQPCKDKRDDFADHLCRTCGRCGYGRSKAPAYANPAQPARPGGRGCWTRHDHDEDNKAN